MKNVFSTRKRLYLLAGFLIAFLVVLNFSTFVLYRRAKLYLDNELGERLRSIATTLAHAVEISEPDSLSGTRLDPALQTVLYLAKTENLLSNIVILTSDGRTVIDLGNFSEAGELNPFVDLDFGAVSLARSGLSSYTSLYKSGDLYMKSAYAPITSYENTVIGIIGVEAGASYFDVLRELSGAIILVDLASLIVIAAMSVFFYRQSLALDRAQAAVIQGENLATMGRMVAGIAHEIRNPLSIIRTSAERLQKKYSIQDEVFAYIKEEVDELDRILSGYLNFARAGSQDIRPHSLVKIVKRCLLILDPEMKKNAVQIDEHYPDGEIEISADDKRLQQAVLNVLINAVQAVDRRGSIDISLETRSKLAVLTVRDNGTGISGKNLKEITRPFYTTKEQGSGLGLSIVSNIVEEHGGKLMIDSAPGVGTAVSITLPLFRA
jgi:signal transduction histidine kinase